MCGIWASVGLNVNRTVLDVISHRGPDGSGWHEIATPVGSLILGHRRLAIIAVDETGAQPMTYANGRYTVVYNGEIYNYRELRQELIACGHRFATLSDTEVLLAAYAEWGISCLGRFNGMFAFALYDTVANRLFLARDRFGVKPLYWWQNSSGFAFASEIKQFTVVPGFAAALNSARAVDFLASGLFDHTEETLFAGVRQVRGGAFLEIDLGPGRTERELTPRSWYQLPEPDSLRLLPEEAAERFLEILRDSVKLRLRADVQVGSCLSGGLDSSAIVGLVHEVLGDHETARRHAFSCCFDVPGLDEKTYVDAVIARTHAVSHLTAPASDDLMQALDALAWHQDEPYGSTSIFAQWSVFALAAHSGIRVMLDGQGADELLAGYHTMFGAHLAGHLAPRRWPELLTEATAIRRRHHTPWLRLMALTLAAALPPSAFSAVLRMAGRDALPAWIGPELRRVAGPSKQTHLRARRGPGQTPLGALCAHQLIRTSVPMLLHYEDRNSMAHSIEARVPFLDYRLVELAIGLGGSNKIEQGETKRLLRRGLAGVLPDVVRTRQDKLGFPTPEELWFKGPLREPLNAMIADAADRLPGLVDGAALKRCSADMLDGRVRFNFGLWRVVSFSLWMRRFDVSF
ncbi:MAG: asparagine synthase (glutamine-hydrolyzing) [Rhodospirillaceae bacterium]